jgi:hypothetical protein
MEPEGEEHCLVAYWDLKKIIYDASVPFAEKQKAVDGELEKRVTVFCSDSDEFQPDIGRMVACCKLMGEPLPEWVKGGKKNA